MVIHKDQSGIAILETVLILVVVGIIGFTGWYVWQSRQTADKTISQTGNSTTLKPTKTGGKPTAKSTTVCAKLEKLCVDVPSNWSVVTNEVKEDEFQKGDELKLQRSGSNNSLTLTSGINGIGGTCDEESNAGKSIYTIKTYQLPFKVAKYNSEWNTPNAYVVAVVTENSSNGATPQVYISSNKQIANVGQYNVCDGAFAQLVNGNNYAIKFTTDQDASSPTVDAAKQELNDQFLTEAYDILKTAHYQN